VKRTLLGRAALLAAAAGLLLSMAACTSSGGSSSSASGSGSRAATPSSPAASGSVVADPNQPFGPGCAQVPASGPGSFQAMSTAPVITAASGNPMLSTLVQAVTTASLVDTLNTTQNMTVFAPANSAFQAIPPDQLNGVMADTAKLTAVLTHHVVAGRPTPDRLSGQLTTLDNDKITLTGSGQSLTISADQTLSGQPAHVLCGNVRTANATVYVIDQVLKPQHLG
jgi:uncharacterized surface protein with fasciclin (FAS1) repeats